MSTRAYQYPMWVSQLAKLLPRGLKDQIRGNLRLHQKLLAITNRTPIRRIALDTLLLGGENGIRANDVARVFDEPLRPSTLAIHSHHVDLLRRYAREGDALLEDAALQATAFYQNIAKCMAFTGHYRGFSRTSDIAAIARHFIEQYLADQAAAQRGRRSTIDDEPVLLMRVQHSSYFQVFDGHHRIARAIMQNATTIRAIILPEVAITPIQDALASVLWVSGRREIYQPIAMPEVQEGWHLVRRCSDRLAHMQTYLKRLNITPPSSYLDLGSNHGWFVDQMLKAGFDARGVERDYFGRQIGVIAYGLDLKRITLSDLENYLDSNPAPTDIVSFFSVIHHTLLAGEEEDAARIIRKIDRITGKVLFFETAHGHENIHPKLAKWNDATIAEFLRANTSFTDITLLGHDRDNVGAFAHAYGRALFACRR